MEKLEKHLLYEIIDGYKIDLEETQLRHLSLEFHRQYKLIKKMETLDYPISKVDLEIYAISEGIAIDIDYAKNDSRFKDKNLEDVVRLQVNKIVNDEKNVVMSNLLFEYKQGNLDAGKELQKMLGTSLHSNANGEIVSIQEYYKEQSTFFENIVNGVELEGLVLWGNGKRETRQFMGLSNVIKRIALTDLVIIGARPSVGKTSFALALMNALYKHDYKPLFISLEMTNGELLQRLATAKSGLSHDLMMSSETKLTPEQIGSYKSGLLEAASMDIKVIDRPPTSWLDMKAMILKHIDEIDYIVIDHMHIISSYDGTPNNNKNNMYGDISRDMKMFSRDYKKPIILLAQLSRDVRSGNRGGKGNNDPSYTKPYMTDLRDSGSIEQDADKIFMLHRYGNKEMQEAHKKYGKYTIALDIEKNRAGKLGTVNYYFEAKTGRWSEIYEGKGEN